MEVSLLPLRVPGRSSLVRGLDGGRRGGVGQVARAFSNTINPITHGAREPPHEARLTEPSALPHVSPAMPTTSPVALVTGGASGIGRALSTALAADGVAVIAADLDLD